MKHSNLFILNHLNNILLIYLVILQIFNIESFISAAFVQY
jgi:hypothetical protein